MGTHVGYCQVGMPFGKNLAGKLILISFFPHPGFVILSLIQYFDPNKHLMLNVGKCLEDHPWQLSPRIPIKTHHKQEVDGNFKCY